LNQCFNENIKLLFVNQFRVIFIVTKDDKVYRLRNSFDGFIPLLALSDDRLEIDKLIRESIFENLCNKGVIDLKNGRVMQLHSQFTDKFIAGVIIIMGNWGTDNS
jgi:hypothetical protein